MKGRDLINKPLAVMRVCMRDFRPGGHTAEKAESDALMALPAEEVKLKKAKEALTVLGIPWVGGSSFCCFSLASCFSPFSTFCSFHSSVSSSAAF